MIELPEEKGVEDDLRRVGPPNDRELVSHDSPGKWSHRRTLAFVVIANLVLWAILIGLGWLFRH